jgi:four helix bundle protein
MVLPHHKSIAFGVAQELYDAVVAAKIRGAHLRDQAERACLNCAEGAGRVSRADKARAFAIARAECVEAIAAVEMAQKRGLADARDFERVRGRRQSVVLDAHEAVSMRRA